MNSGAAPGVCLPLASVAPHFISSRTTSLKPLLFARSIAVEPPFGVVAAWSAPDCNSKRTTSNRPRSAARCKAVQPAPVQSLTSAPALISDRAARRSPLSQASRNRRAAPGEALIGSRAATQQACAGRRRQQSRGNAQQAKRRQGRGRPQLVASPPLCV